MSELSMKLQEEKYEAELLIEDVNTFGMLVRVNTAFLEGIPHEALQNGSRRIWNALVKS